MVVKDNLPSSIPPISIPEPPQRSVMDQSSPSHAAFPSSARILAMAPGNQQQHVSPYGPPPPADQQPASASQPPQQPPQSAEHQGQSYPQYSYDIHLRYPQPPHTQQPQPQSQTQAQAQPLPSRTYANVPPYTGEPLPPMNFAHVEPGGQNYHFEAPPQSMDTTGQVPPPGMKPRVTATLWEDESTLCFQVDVKGTCVARREDNHMINGTKLLNVAGMTRGRRDGILKSEKVKHVVKIGPMHLKGVWIPYERALDFANKEKITELLYPLFVHNIGALLHHPINRGYSNQIWEEPSNLAQIPRSHESLPNPQSLTRSPPPVQGQGNPEWKGAYMYNNNGNGVLPPPVEGEPRG